MIYRIELERINSCVGRYAENEYADGVVQVKTFLAECVPNGYRVSKIVKTTKDGRGYDVTNKYIKGGNQND